MYGIDILVDEHKNILKLIDCMKKSCYDILKGEAVDTDLFRTYIDIARNYADKHHHGKEELILFKYMVENMGVVAEKLVNYGMLIEHDYGRLYLSNLETALSEYDNTKEDIIKLDIIGNTMGYVAHLTRHIDKEDNVVYTFADRELSDELKKIIDDETINFENEFADRREHYSLKLQEVVNKVFK